MNDFKKQLEIIKQGIDEIIGEDDLIEKLKSLSSPSTCIMQASFARDVLIFFAISNPSTFWLKLIFLPSGNFISGIR